MENSPPYPQVDSSLNDLNFSYEAQNHLKQAAKWAKTISVLGLITQGLAIIFVLVALVASIVSPYVPIHMVGIFLVYIGALVVAIYLSIKLLQFSIDSDKAITRGDSHLLTIAMRQLNTFFTTAGILTILYLVLVVVVVVIAVILELGKIA